MNFTFSEEDQMFQQMVRDWVEKETPKNVARDWEAKEHEYPFELWDKMSAAGFHAIGLPEEVGGQGGGITTQMILARELARSLAGLTWIWGISSFCAKSVDKFASDDLRHELLPQLASGDIRMAIAVTEPSGGTDVLGGMKTFAKKVDGGYSISGSKIWSTAAHVSQYLLLIARTDAEVSKASQGITIFLVPNPSEGLTINQIPKVGMRSVGSCEVFLDEVFVPDALVVGQEGQGWYQMLETLNNERIMVGALCTGVIDGVLEDAVDYLKERTAFGKPIGRMQVLQHYIADIAMWQKQSELIVQYAASLQEQGLPCGVEATMCKVIASEYAGKAADLGLQMLGGMGYAMETNMQRYWRDSRLYRIGPITNEMARNVIAESFGLGRSF